MVVRAADCRDDDAYRAAGARPPTNPRRGGLVSSRVQMFEKPAGRNEKPAIAALRENNNIRKGYWSRPQDSFDSPPSLLEEEKKKKVLSVQADETRDSSPPSDETDDDHASYVGSTLVESGIHYYQCGEYEKALKAFNTALKTQRVSVGDEDICIALTLGNLGAVHLQQGNLAEAEAMLLESLFMKRRIKPKMIVADTLNNLGNCCNLRGDNEKSLDYYREALEDLRSKKGLPQDIANALFNMGRLEIQQRDWDAARNMLTGAWRMTREIYGSNHIFVAQTLDLIGLVQLSTNDFDAAMISFTKALGVYRRLHGPLHLDVANSLFHVGMVREAKGELADAWESYTTTRDLYSRLGTDPGHPGFRTVRQSISKVEKAIMRENQERLIEKHKEARGERKARENQERLVARHRQARSAKGSTSPKSMKSISPRSNK